MLHWGLSSGVFYIKSRSSLSRNQEKKGAVRLGAVLWTKLFHKFSLFWFPAPSIQQWLLPRQLYQQVNCLSGRETHDGVRRLFMWIGWISLRDMWGYSIFVHYKYFDEYTDKSARHSCSDSDNKKHQRSFFTRPCHPCYSLTSFVHVWH